MDFEDKMNFEGKMEKEEDFMICMSMADYIESGATVMPFLIKDGDDWVYCNEQIYEELRVLTKGFTESIDSTVMIYKPSQNKF